MVRAGDADGMVSGATCTTANTIRPALQASVHQPARVVLLALFVRLYLSVETELRVRLSLTVGCWILENRQLESAADAAALAAACRAYLAGFCLWRRACYASRRTLNAHVLALWLCLPTVANKIHRFLPPCLAQILKTQPPTLVSSIFFMCLPDKVLTYGDCAVVVDPKAEELAEVAICSGGASFKFVIELFLALWWSYTEQVHCLLAEQGLDCRPSCCVPAKGGTA